jgi:ATP-dependent 26S proteasome regulatory subunit
MDARDEVQELCALLRSRFPIILIESHEEPRILELLQKAANLENQVMMCWSITAGIRRHGRDEAIYQTNELLDALKHVDKTLQNGLYVLCDAHPGFKDPVVMRLIREIALSHYRTARTLVFVSPRLDELPSEVLRLSAHFHPKLPDRDAIRAIVTEEAKRYEQQSGEKPRGDRNALDMLIMHLLGMEQDDVRRLVRQALRDDGAINADDVRRVLATKYEALGGRATLAYEHSKVRFDDVGGLERLKHWITLRRKPFLDPTATEVDRPKGIVLLGVQGGGKSLAARAVAGEWGVPLMRLDFGTLYNKYYGETERNLRNALAAAESMSPCVLWIDEIEKGISTDSGEGDGGVSRRVLGSLLTWMAERKEPVFIVATSNDISQLPPELVRKGRFDEIFFVDFPNPMTRRQIAAIHLKKRGFDPAKFEIDGIAKLADGYSGAEIEQAIVSASFEARARGEALRPADVLAEIEHTRPLSVVMAEKIDALRAWACDRAVFADEPEAEPGDEELPAAA